MKTILLIGSYGSGNLGDEALKAICQEKLSERFKVLVLTGAPREKNEAIHFPFGIRSSLSFKWIRSFFFLKKSDVVVFGGGGLFAEHESLKAIGLWSTQVFWAWLFKKPILLIGQSVGPFKTKLGLSLTKWSLSKCKEIQVRDPASAKTLQREFPEIEFKKNTDLCFAYGPKTPQPQKKIAVNLRPWKGDLKPLLAQLESFKSRGYKLHFVSMDPKDKSLMKKWGEVKVFHDFEKLTEFLSNCEICIGMRLHFLIAATLSGSKVVGVSYSQKVSGLLEDLSLKTIEFEAMNETSLKEAVESAQTAKNVNALHEEALAILNRLSI